MMRSGDYVAVCGCVRSKVLATTRVARFESIEAYRSGTPWTINLAPAKDKLTEEVTAPCVDSPGQFAGALLDLPSVSPGAFVSWLSMVGTPSVERTTVPAPGFGRRTASGNSRRNRLTKVASGSYLVSMRAVGLKVLKNKLSEYVRLVQSGETVLVTDRDKVVAELVPPRTERSPIVADAFLADAVRKGWVAPPTVRSDEPPPRLPVASLAEVLEGLDEDRSER